MKKSSCTIPVTLLLMFYAVLPVQARDFTGVELKTIHVSGNVYMLEGVNGFAGGNIGVSVGKDGLLIVDDQFAEMNEKIRTALAELKPGNPVFVLNTHWHGDHTGGNELFSTDATIIAHENVRLRLMSEQKNAFATSPAQPEAAWPVITFDESLNIHFNNETIRVQHLPNGHTDGDAVIFFTGSNVVHLGDHFFVNRFPFIDIATGGNALRFVDNLVKVLNQVPEGIPIIPGHGPLSNREELAEYESSLSETIQIVREQVDEGATLEEIKKRGLPERLDSWGQGFISTDQWITFIHQSLSE